MQVSAYSLLAFWAAPALGPIPPLYMRRNEGKLQGMSSPVEHMFLQLFYTIVGLDLSGPGMEAGWSETKAQVRIRAGATGSHGKGKCLLLKWHSMRAKHDGTLPTWGWGQRQIRRGRWDLCSPLLLTRIPLLVFLGHCVSVGSTLKKHFRIKAEIISLPYKGS